MKAITLYQPWASAMAVGVKSNETRSWYTDYRGPMVIHAGKTREHINDRYLAAWPEPLIQGKSFPFGAIVAVGVLIGCVKTHLRTSYQTVSYMDLDNRFQTTTIAMLPGAEEQFWGDYSPGRFAWVYRDIRRLPEPIPARGAQGLWEWTPPEGFEIPNCLTTDT